MQISNDRDQENIARLHEQIGESNEVAPTFVARFSDGIVTKMTCYCAHGNLDLRRGIVLSRAAYESRTKGKKPPPIAKAHFQTLDGVVLREYDDKAIADGEGTRAPR
jgi:hypothetical protein